MKEIENIQELKNRKGGRSLAIVKLLGKQVVGDGYAGTFYWCSECNQSDDGVSIIKSDLSDNGRWIRASSNEYLGDALSQYFVTNNEDITLEQIFNAFNVELRDVNEKRLGFIIDPHASSPEIEITITNLVCI